MLYGTIRSIPLWRGVVNKINLSFFYNLGAAINPMVGLQANVVDRYQMYGFAFVGKQMLQALLDSFPLTVCQTRGRDLITDLEPWLTIAPDAVPQLTPVERANLYQLTVTVKDFETVLSDELQTGTAYIATRKGIYSTPDLIERTEELFPDLIRVKLPKAAIQDVRESGCCLAFDRATASAFHIMRATETVIHQYYLAVCKPEDETTLENWGAYIKALTDSGDLQAKTVVSILQQVKDQHRNLIMHPEAFLSPEEGFTLFQVAQAAIIAMAGRLPALPAVANPQMPAAP